MTGRNTAYTHRHWTEAMRDLHAALSGQLVPALEHIQAGLRRVDAGRTQMAMHTRAIGMVRDNAARATVILADHGPRLAQVSEAQRAAGGVDEVAADKRYNQR